MKLPIMQDKNSVFMSMQTRWAALIEPFLSKPVINGVMLSDLNLVSGDNVINHRLQRNLQGYLVIAQNAAAQFYQKTSTMPELTLVLNSSATVKVSLYVF